MHRMHQRKARAGLYIVVVIAVVGPRAGAGMIRPRHTFDAPEITAAIAGTVRHEYDPATRTGQLQASTTPYLLTLGPSAGDETDVRPGEDGVRGEDLVLRLTADGRLVDDPSNAFTVRGTVTVSGQRYQGVLLQGAPTAFTAAVDSPAVFELNVAITGGALAHLFGPDVYIRLTTAQGSGFTGDYRRSFDAGVEGSHTVSLHARARQPSTITEPAALAILVASGSWVVFRRRARPRFRRAYAC